MRSVRAGSATPVVAPDEACAELELPCSGPAIATDTDVLRCAAA
jgi:hypothetical protein